MGRFSLNNFYFVLRFFIAYLQRETFLFSIAKVGSYPPVLFKINPVEPLRMATPFCKKDVSQRPGFLATNHQKRNF